jgi:hypothetical protein
MKRCNTGGSPQARRLAAGLNGGLANGVDGLDHRFGHSVF